MTKKKLFESIIEILCPKMAHFVPFVACAGIICQFFLPVGTEKELLLGKNQHNSDDVLDYLVASVLFKYGFKALIWYLFS